MIDELARAAGILPSYTDYFGREKTVSPETKRAILAALGYDAASDRQAHRIARELTAHNAAAQAPAAEDSVAYVPPDLERERIWGFALQLYSLRSSSNWGMGDFGDLQQFARMARELGAGIVGLNPLHQLHLTDPKAASPYSPLSRLHLNALYIDVPAAFAHVGCPFPGGHRAEYERLRATDFVDYEGVAAQKFPALRALYWWFVKSGAVSRHPAFQSFCDEGGVELKRMAVYETLTFFFKGQNPDAYGWPVWPADFQDPDSATVARFAAENADLVTFFEFLQWLAASQLAAAAQSASGMTIGLYRDLAIGVSTGSVDVWSDRGAYCRGLSIGAPPDELNTNGQDWGLPPMHPQRLRDRGCAPFAAVVRANMRYAGALRIDHVMGLQRLFVIPHGATPEDGAYLQYPREALIAALVSESRRARCLVVGEDLGTLPPDFRRRMARSRIFSCRLLFFEPDPARYPHDAVASTGTHDLPPLLGYWTPPDADAIGFVAGAYRSLAQTPARIRLLQMEDALLCREAVNVPGTTTEAPNWRRKLPVAVEALRGNAGFTAAVRAVSETPQRKEHR